MHNFLHKILVFLLVFQIFSAHCCIQHERDALLEFKAGVRDIFNRLDSWRGNKCCDWEGVRCSNQTGHIVELNLRNTNFEIGIDENIDYDWNYHSLAGKISPSLVSLSDLKYLDLSFNNFSGNKFPEFVSLFQNLKYLNLSHTGLIGMIPPQLGNLSMLLYLDLSYDVYSGLTLNSRDTWWLSNLRSLKYMDMSGVKFRDSSGWVQESLNKLPSLEVLVLSDNGLTQISNSLTFVNFTSLRVLHISDQNFNSTLPNWLGSLPSLTDLIMEDCYLVGPYPTTLGNLTSLNKLALGLNSLDGMIPPLYSLTKLTHISLRYNNIEVEIVDFFDKLSNYTLRKLDYLDLSSTNMAGTLSGWIGDMTSLSFLSLSSNNLTGTIPMDFRNLTKLVHIDLSSNSLTGLLSEAQLNGLLKLKYLDITENNITIFPDNNWTPSFQLNIVFLGSCKLGPKFPAWLQGQVEIEELNLMDTGIDDNIPSWLWSFCSLWKLYLSYNRLRGNLPASLVHLKQLMIMDLSNNRLEGEIPFLPISLFSLRLSNNSFSGQLRKTYKSSYEKKSVLLNDLTGVVVELFPCGLTNLTILDLSSNNLSGHLPPCWSNMGGLLILANNKFSGIAPSTFSCSKILRVVNLNNNNLAGEFPIDLKFCSVLELLDLGENKYTGEIPDWVGENLHQMIYLRLRSNLFYGYIPSTLTRLGNLQVLDLGNNNLSGPLPRYLDNFTAMGQFISASPVYYDESLPAMTKGLNLVYDSVLLMIWKSIDFSNNNLTGEIPQNIVVLTGLLNLNLSHNHLTGKIPFDIGNMTSLESLDLQMNNLSGTIPQSMSLLYSLEVLNLSYNNLSGSIPTGHQLQSLDDPSIYSGNPNLCGPPLKMSCKSPKSDDNNDSKSKHAGYRDNWFYLFIEFGFVVGFLVVFFTLLFKRNWRYDYFRMIDSGINRLHVLTALALERWSAERA
ncbi:Receptor-like protein 12 [Rhynchospora pubera]|uniref:Receptor-like protein 12 n=1 Tax=Rhynchospora pubera TaxID=906938 RepID=A0AAV8EWH7_9POAL|nr:Receptor-like protein 12 [Rhynchospora pubera]